MSQKKITSVRLSHETHLKLKKICVDEEITMQDWIESLIEHAIQSKETHEPKK